MSNTDNKSEDTKIIEESNAEPEATVIEGEDLNNTSGGLRNWRARFQKKARDRALDYI